MKTSGQQFVPFGEEPFLIPMQEHPHIVKLHRKSDEDAAHFGAPTQIGHFNALLLPSNNALF